MKLRKARIQDEYQENFPDHDLCQGMELGKTYWFGQNWTGLSTGEQNTKSNKSLVSGGSTLASLTRKGSIEGNRVDTHKLYRL